MVLIGVLSLGDVAWGNLGAPPGEGGAQAAP